MNNPIIQRELIGTLRQPRAMIFMVTALAALGALVVLRWPSDGLVGAAEDGGVDQAGEVLRVFAYGMMVAVMLLVPAFPASSIVKERQKGTLALLLNSPLTPLTIYVGKLVAALGFVLLMLVATLPLAAACHAMGGVSGANLLSLYGVLAVAAVQYATLALWVSSRATSIDAAMRMTYAGVLLLGIVALAPQQFIGNLVGAGTAGALEWISSLSPLPGVTYVLGLDLGAAAAIAEIDVRQFLLLGGLSSALFAGLTIQRLGQRMLDAPRPHGRVTDERSNTEKALRRIMYLWFFDPARRAELIGPLTNPVMVKEFRARRFGRSGWIMRLIALCLIVSLALMLLATVIAGQQVEAEYRGIEQQGAITVLLQVALIVLLTPTLASGLISTERETGGWQLLQVTPMSPLRIVVGKLLSVALILALVLLATLPGYIVLIAADLDQALRVMDVIVTLVLTALLSLMLSATVSSLFSRTAVSTTISYALLVSICLVPMLVWLAEDAPFTRATVESVLRYNPLAAALNVINARQFADYDLVPFNWNFMLVASAGLCMILIVQTWRLTRPR